MKIDTSKKLWTDYHIDVDEVVNTIQKKDPEVTFQDLGILGKDKYGLPVLKSKKQDKLFRFLLCREKDRSIDESKRFHILSEKDREEIEALEKNLEWAEGEVQRIKEMIQAKEDSLDRKTEMFMKKYNV